MKRQSMEWHLREFTFKQADILNTETDGYCWLLIFGIVMVCSEMKPILQFLLLDPQKAATLHSNLPA